MKELKIRYGDLLLQRYFTFLMSDPDNFITYCPCHSPGHNNDERPRKKSKTKTKAVDACKDQWTQDILKAMYCTVLQVD